MNVNLYDKGIELTIDGKRHISYFCQFLIPLDNKLFNIIKCELLLVNYEIYNKIINTFE